MLRIPYKNSCNLHLTFLTFYFFYKKEIIILSEQENCCRKLFYGGLGLVVTWQIFVRLDGWWKLLGIAALAFSLQQWYCLFFGAKKVITKMEEIFDKNGGFVWSDETY